MYQLDRFGAKRQNSSESRYLVYRLRHYNSINVHWQCVLCSQSLRDPSGIPMEADRPSESRGLLRPRKHLIIMVFFNYKYVLYTSNTSVKLKIVICYQVYNNSLGGTVHENTYSPLLPTYQAPCSVRTPTTKQRFLGTSAWKKKTLQGFRKTNENR